MTPPQAPQGWKAYVGSAALLQRLDLTAGPPDQLGWLRPKDGPQGKNWSTDLWMGLQKERWHFPKGRPPDDNGIWLSCVYGRHGTTILGKRLDDNVSECKATYRTDKQGVFSIEFQCKW